MIIDGNPFTPFEVQILDYSYDIQDSMNWFEMGDGSYKASDRGKETDHILTDISFKGKKAYIENLISNLKSNHNDNALLTLTDIKEPIFGQNVDYTETVQAVIEEFSIKEQTSLNAYLVSMTLRAVNLTFLNLGNTLPELKCLQHSYVGDTEWSFINNVSYNNTYDGVLGNVDISKFQVDRGIFEGTFTFSNDEIGKLLDFKRNTRSVNFTLPIITGVTYPFGTIAGAGPYQAKLYKIQNINRIAPNFWTAKIVFVQDF